MNIKVSFIGSGRVATQLAQVLSRYDISINQIVSQTKENAIRLANLVDAKPCFQLNQIEPVDILFIAVSDQAIVTIVEQLQLIKYSNLVVHTSGSTSIEVLTNHQLDAGVFYPLQTFSFGQNIDWKNTPLLLEIKHENNLELLTNVAECISEQVYIYSSKQRQSLHLAAVFACNFSNYCYDIAQQILQVDQVDHRLLMPLIIETATKLQDNLAYVNQTGPAKRQDINIIDFQKNMLKSKNNEWYEIYHLMSQAIIKRHSK